MKWSHFKSSFNWRKTLFVVIISLGTIALCDRWRSTLGAALLEARRELRDSRSLLDSDLEVQDKEMESLKVLKTSQQQNENWADTIAPLIAEQKLVLRQQRPLGIEQRGKIKEERLFVQVEGNMESLLGFLHYMASQESSSIYVSRYLVTSRMIGTGLVSVELVLARAIL